jgi:hypothetical protein
VVLDTAREALRQAGYDSTAVEPVCFREPCSAPEGYFARNTIDGNAGYVLWRIKDEARRPYHLNVAIKREGAYIYCTVGEAK